jgi:nitroreductase
MSDLVKVLKERRSIRKYKAEQIKSAELDTILEAGTYAPTGMGSQSPVIVVVQDKGVIDILEKINAVAFGQPGGHPFYGAPTILNVFADKTKVTPVHDASLVMGNLMNAATALGIGSCWIHRAKEVFESHEGKELKKKWGLGDHFEGVAHCILGYAEEKPAAKPRKDGYIIRDR